ncbi:glycine dehydrogenase [Edaphovirga cremea]|uniref:glycine dehydrogenase n=1 Tax=Edaphovirga cremea TaxID=2267246 RepID=UPI0039892465
MNDGAESANAATDSNTAVAIEITERVLTEITAMLNGENIYPNAVQKQMLDSHIRAMVFRSLTGEPLPDVDKSLFDEISSQSMEMAERVVNSLGNLPIEEAYLLSVHFEVAKENDQTNSSDQ